MCSIFVTGSIDFILCYYEINFIIWTCYVFMNSSIDGILSMSLYVELYLHFSFLIN